MLDFTFSADGGLYIADGYVHYRVFLAVWTWIDDEACLISAPLLIGEFRLSEADRIGLICALVGEFRDVIHRTGNTTLIIDYFLCFEWSIQLSIELHHLISLTVCARALPRCPALAILDSHPI